MSYLQRRTDLSVFAFVVSSMLTMGLSQRLPDVIAPLRKPLPVLLALLVNFALSPLVVADADFDDPAITVMLLVAFVVSLIVLPVLARAMRSRTAEFPRSR